MDAATKFAVPLILVLVAVAGCLGTAATGRPVHVILSAAGAASCGALSQTFLKLVSLEAKESLGGGSPFEDPTLLLSLSGLLFTAPSQLRLLTAALAVARASLAVPLYQSSLIAFTTCIGGVAFNEFASMRPLGIAGYSGGLLLATVGLVMLSVSSESPSFAEDAAKDPDPDTYIQDDPARLVGRERRRSMRISVPAVSVLGLAVIETQHAREEIQRARAATVSDVPKNYVPPKLDGKRQRAATML
eukprot:529364-Prymnesium_polylepis.1